MLRGVHRVVRVVRREVLHLADVDRAYVAPEQALDCLGRRVEAQVVGKRVARSTRDDAHHHTVLDRRVVVARHEPVDRLMACAVAADRREHVDLAKVLLLRQVARVARVLRLDHLDRCATLLQERLDLREDLEPALPAALGVDDDDHAPQRYFTRRVCALEDGELVRQCHRRAAHPRWRRASLCGCESARSPRLGSTCASSPAPSSPSVSRTTCCTSGLARLARSAATSSERRQSRAALGSTNNCVSSTTGAPPPAARRRRRRRRE